MFLLPVLSFLSVSLLLLLLLLLLLPSPLKHSLCCHGGYVKLNTYLLQFLCYRISDATFFAHTFFYLPFIYSKVTAFYKLK